jgi:hypothetical protein
MINLRKMRLARHVSCMEAVCIKYWKERDIGTDGRVILKWMLKKQDRRMCYGLIWLRIGISGMLL